MATVTENVVELELEPSPQLPLSNIWPPHIEEVRDLYFEAERALKKIEHLHHEGLVIPTVNELRYAGNHLLRAFQTQDSAEALQEFEKAKNHCKRAYYDAIELGTLAYLEKFEQFTSDYRLVSISSVIPNYAEILHLVNSVKKFIADTTKDERHLYYLDLEKHYNPLTSALELLDASRQELNKAMTLRRRAILSSVAFLIVAVVTLFFTAVPVLDGKSESGFEQCIETYSNARPGAIDQAVAYCKGK